VIRIKSIYINYKKLQANSNCFQQTQQQQQQIYSNYLKFHHFYRFSKEKVKEK